jgi:hypothetical protein
MLLPSSLPAHAASAIGSINIAAHFANVPKLQSVIRSFPPDES